MYEALEKKRKGVMGIQVIGDEMEIIQAE